MLESYIFKQISAKLLRRQSSTIVETVLGCAVLQKPVFSH